jgi:hypothetical protein
LCTNIQKSEVYPIGCSHLQIDEILEGFPAVVKEFPYRYLGLPLHTKKLRKIDFLPVGTDTGMVFYPWVAPIPDPNRDGYGTGIFSHPRVTRRVPDTLLPL